MNDLDEATQCVNQAVTGPMPVCSRCKDTHFVEADVGRQMCTRCPVPCQKCRAGGNGPYCETTPCSCECHRATEVKPPPDTGRPDGEPSDQELYRLQSDTYEAHAAEPAQTYGSCGDRARALARRALFGAGREFERSRAKLTAQAGSEGKK